MVGSEHDAVAAPTHRPSDPVGVLDTGVGGLTILDELLREVPGERFVYFGDTGNCPYGVRPVGEIQALSIAAVRFLIAQGAKVIVVACNTMSVSALPELRAAFDVPIIGVVPAVKPAAEHTRVGRIGVAATEASANGTFLRQLIAEHANGVHVEAVGCPRLVLLAEAGILDEPEAEAAIRGYITPILDDGIDQLVLGCTHFPAMRAAFERVAGPGVAVIDSGAAVARQTRRVLVRDGLLSPADTGPTTTPRALGAGDAFWCSGDVPQFERVATAILRQPVRARLAPGMVLAPDAV